MSSRIRYTDDDEIVARADAEERQVLDASGQSDFPQLPSRGDVKVAFGTATVTGDGSVSVGDTIAHGLGKTPTAVVVTANDSQLNVATTNFTSTTFGVVVRNVYTESGWSDSMDLSWIAIG